MTTKILKDLFIIPDFDRSAAAVSFTVPGGCSMVQWDILDCEKVITRGMLDTRLLTRACFEANIQNFRPWNIDTPFLYTLRMLLVIHDSPVEIKERFGMRKIHTADNQIYVNNEKFYVRGYIRGRDAHDHPNFENLPLYEYYARNIRNAKKYGFNFIRFHSRVPLEECFRAADEIGIFIHIEVRDYYGKYQKERNMTNDEGELVSKEKWGEVILKYRNHPSFMVYCMGNEIPHPGTNPQVIEISNITKELDPTRLFIDTCAHGEYDRNHVDIDVQHMSYYYPFGKNYDMFDHTYNWYIYGSSKGVPLFRKGQGLDGAYRIMRALDAKHPVLAHEICHYVALHDIDALDEKFSRLKAPKPWWIDELKKLVMLKGLENDYPLMLAASRHFQFLSWKLCMEAARRSPLLSGFHFLQLSDTERYENSNGILDCFDDPKGIEPSEFLKFNCDTVILADLPRRTYFEGESITIPVTVSHFSPDISGDADFSFSLEDAGGAGISITGDFNKVSLERKGRYEIAIIEFDLPSADKAHELILTFRLKAIDSNRQIQNSWRIWLYPNRPEQLPSADCTVQLDEVTVALRYPQLRHKGTLQAPVGLMIVNRFTDEVFSHLAGGGDCLMLYRVPQTRDRKTSAKREKYSLPTTWDRFKTVIWDRGTNCGAFIRKSRALDGFPNCGFMDLQFHTLVDDCDKVILDDFPCPVEPVMQGVDKAVRDRFDVYTYKLPQLQPAWTMRKFGYMFELQAGQGRLFVTGLNFTGLNSGIPDTCAMFESILRYIMSEDFKPAQKISVEQLKLYLEEKGRQPLPRERKMTQFWQLNDMPLESERYWKEAEDYLDSVKNLR